MNKSFKWTGLVMALWVFLVLLPVLPLPLYAFMRGGWPWPGIFPKALSLETFRRAAGPGTLRALLESVGIALACVGLNVLIALPAADVLGRGNPPFKRVLEGFFLMPALVPPLMVAMGLYRQFLVLGLTETRTGVVLIHMVPTLPYMIRTLTIAYSQYGRGYEEQARVLGAGPFKTFRQVTLPYLMPALRAGAGITILVSMAQYVSTFLIGGGAVQTLTLRMMPYLSGGNLPFGAVYTLFFAAASAALLSLVSGVLGRFYEA